MLMFGAALIVAIGGTHRDLASALTDPTEAAVDQHFSGCDAARAAGRENIPSWDPSYRRSMDGDGDGLACEPYRY